MMMMLRMLTGAVAIAMLLAQSILRALTGLVGLAWPFRKRGGSPRTGGSTCAEHAGHGFFLASLDGVELLRVATSTAGPRTRAAAWLEDGDDVGVSARTIHDVLTGTRTSDWSFDAPHDADDFGRCARLLELIPEWAGRLGEVADACYQFRRLARCWPELTRLYERGETRLLTAVIRDLRERNDAPIRMTVRREWELIDADPALLPGGKRAERTLPPGTHDMERIRNPLTHDGYWLVLKGTRLGASEGSWRQWSNVGATVLTGLRPVDDWLITFGSGYA